MQYIAVLDINELPGHVRPVRDGQYMVSVRKLQPGEIGWNLDEDEVVVWGKNMPGPSVGVYLVVEEVVPLPDFPKELGPDICGIAMTRNQAWVGFTQPTDAAGGYWQYMGPTFCIQARGHSVLPKRLPDIDPKHWRKTWIPNPNWEGSDHE